MTNIKIYKNNGDIFKIKCHGHTGFAEYGQDILCSSISSIIQTACIGVESVAKLDFKLNIKDKKGLLDFEITQKDALNNPNGFKISQYILSTMLLGLQNLALQYADYINLEVIEDDYD